MLKRLQRRARSILALLLFAAGFFEGRALILGPRRQGNPAIADEYVYIFQAKLLASGHLSLPPPPLPEFFEAAHLLVVPRFAGKYLPGHALFLLPFELLHSISLGPSVALGLLASLLFLAACAARLPTGAAFLAGSLPLFTEPIATLFGSYLSWTSSLPCTAAALLCLFVLKETRSAGWLALSSALAGLLFWIRPFTGLALIAAIGVVMLAHLRSVSSPRTWLLAASLPLIAWVLLTLAVCKNVTGHFAELPWTLYAREYMPFDGPGFGPTHTSEPERLVPQLQHFFDALRLARDHYTLAAAIERTPGRLRTFTQLEPSEYLWPLALFGLAASSSALSPAILFLLFFSLLQFTFYAPTPFYLSELTIPLVLGLAAASAQIWKWIAEIKKTVPRGAALIAASLPVMLLAVGFYFSGQAIYARATSGSPPNIEIEAALAALSDQRTLVFVRYPPLSETDQHYNEPDFQHARMIRALDLGPRDVELMARLPDRTTYLLDMSTRTLTKLKR